jgi:hypothetical protein
MSNCSVCGEPTQLHVHDKPICPKCYAANPEERRMRSAQQSKESGNESGANRIEQVMTAKGAV